MNRAALVAGLCLLILGGAAIYANKTYWSPRSSILALGSAMHRRDRDTVAEYVDAPALAESLRRCALESYQREMAKAKSDDFIHRLLTPLGEQLMAGLAEATLTPDSLISMMCGEAPKEAMKRGVAGYTDQTVDALTKDGNPKTQVYGAIGKVLVRWASGYVIEEASESANAKPSDLNPDDYDVSAQYESANRYLITITHRKSDNPAFGLVFKRHGLANWKLTELRLLPQ